MRSGIRAQFLTFVVGLLLTAAAVEVAWAVSMNKDKTTTVKPYAADYPTRTLEKLVISSAVPSTASVTIPMTIIVPVPVMMPFATSPEELAALVDPSTTVPEMKPFVASPEELAAMNPYVPTTVPATKVPATTVPATTSGAAESDELVFEQPKDYTKLAVELEMNDIVPASKGSVPATGPAVPSTKPH